MDRIVFDDDSEKKLKIWLGFAEYIKVDFLPFDDISLSQSSASGSNETILRDGNRVIEKIKNAKGDTGKVVFKIKLVDGRIKVDKVTFIDLPKEVPNDKVMEVVTATCEMLSNVFAYINNYNMEENDRAKHMLRVDMFLGTISKGGGSPQHKKQNGSSNKSYSVDGIREQYSSVIHKRRVKYNTEKAYNDREYNRHTESWTVRGFYRKNKNGTTTWIKPHIRGNGEKKSKIYKI